VVFDDKGGENFPKIKRRGSNKRRYHDKRRGSIKMIKEEDQLKFFEAHK
jgi:hypothetical protein